MLAPAALMHLRRRGSGAVTRPTCTSLAKNKMVGPLLLKPKHMQSYLAYVKAFNTDVFSNATLISDMEAHAKALQPLVKDDEWGKYIDYTLELRPDASKWADPQSPLLPVMKARAASVSAQLAALDAGTYPRLPSKVTESEKCQNWKATETPKVTGDSGKFIISDVCPFVMEIWGCKEASGCFSHDYACAADGTFTTSKCKEATGCSACYPNSRCGTLTSSSDVDEGKPTVAAESKPSGARLCRDVTLGAIATMLAAVTSMAV